jgi:hypothetical protein
MSFISLAFNRTVGRKLYRTIGNKIADILDSTDQERATIVKTATVIGSIAAAVVTMDAAGALDAVDAGTSVADVADHATTASDVHFGGYHDPYGHPLTTPDVNGTSWDHDGNRFPVSGGTSEGQPDPSR